MHKRPLTAVAILALSFVLTVLPGCGKKSSPAAPAPGGGTPAEPFNSGTFSSSSPTKVFVHTFPAEGTYSYLCSIHGASMSGTLHCAVGMPESALVNVADNQFIPSSAHVRPGGYVKWTATGGNHTVTR